MPTSARPRRRHDGLGPWRAPSRNDGCNRVSFTFEPPARAAPHCPRRRWSSIGNGFVEFGPIARHAGKTAIEPLELHGGSAASFEEIYKWSRCGGAVACRLGGKGNSARKRLGAIDDTSLRQECRRAFGGSMRRADFHVRQAASMAYLGAALIAGLCSFGAAGDALAANCSSRGGLAYLGNTKGATRSVWLSGTTARS